jgi:hypothetical protein
MESVASITNEGSCMAGSKEKKESKGDSRDDGGCFSYISFLTPLILIHGARMEYW